MIDKTNEVINSQLANVDHIYELAQAMKEKIDDGVTIEGQIKAMDLLQNQLVDKEKENEALRQQLQNLMQAAAEQSKKYRTEVERIKGEIEHLKK